MPMRFILMSTLACTLGLVVLVTPVEAQSARQQFQQRYGSELRDPSTQLNAEPFARRMLDDAEALIESGERPELAQLILEECYKFASTRATSYDVAQEAAELAIERVPELHDEAMTWKASVLQRKIRVADPAEAEALERELVDLFVRIGQTHEHNGRLDAARTFYERAQSAAADLRGFSSGPIDAGLRRVTTLELIQSLEAQLRRNRTDAEAAERLMRLYLVERDDPEAAHEYRFTADDRELRQLTRLAAQPLENLLPDECLDLGAFYTELADDASPEAVGNMLERARGYYQHYLDGNPRNQVEVRRVRQAVAQLDTRISQLPDPDTIPTEVTQVSPTPDDEGAATPAPPSQPPAADPAPPRQVDNGRWQDLLADIDVETAGLRGVWERRNGELVGSPPTPCLLRLPIRPELDRSGSGYILETTFTRTAPGGSVAVNLPLGGNYHVLLKVGDRRRAQRDHIAGLEMLDSKPAFDNESTVPFALEEDHRYTLRVRVEVQGIEVRVDVTIDDEPLLEWHGFRAAVSMVPAWQAFDETSPGLGVDAGATVVFHDARIQMLDGDN